MNKYNVWNKWGKLKTVMLGDNYCSEFFRDIKNPRIRSALQRISDETQEDLAYYEHVLKDFGCDVIRPVLDKNDSIMNYLDDQGHVYGSQGVPRSPLQPRDGQFVAGNKLFLTSIEKGVYQALKNYNSKNIVEKFCLVETSDRYWPKHQFESIAGADWGCYEDYKNDPNYYLNLNPIIAKEIKELHSIGFGVPAPSFTVIGRDIFIDQGDKKITKN